MGDNIAPRFTKKPALSQDGAAIIFGCQIEASPRPDITWYRSDAILNDSDRIKISVTQVSGTNLYDLGLRINNVTPADSGTYKVEAGNALGKMAANVNLNLQRK